MPAGRPCKFGSRLSNGKCPPNPSKPAKGTGKRGRPAGAKNKTRKSPKVKVVKEKAGKKVGKWELVRIYANIPTLVDETETWKNANKEGHYAVESVSFKIVGAEDGKDHTIEFDFTDELRQMYIIDGKEYTANTISSSFNNQIKMRKWPKITSSSLDTSKVKVQISGNDEDYNNNTTQNIKEIISGQIGRHFTGMKDEEDEATIIAEIAKLIVASS